MAGQVPWTSTARRGGILCGANGSGCDEDGPRRIIGTAGFDSVLCIQRQLLPEKEILGRPAATAIESRATRA